MEGIMKYTPPSFEKISQMASIDVGRLTEDQARGILEDIRWPDEITCPHCDSNNITKIHAKSDKIRDGVIQCNNCRKQFTVTVGTIMHRSHITLRQWIQAFYSMCSHKKGVSALQLQRNLGLHSYRSAWHLSHRIRKAMTQKTTNLKGIIETDEAYIGGKPRPGSREIVKRGRGTKKTPVMVIVEREGNAFSKPVKNVNAKTLKSAIKEMVNKNSTIMTDEWPAYKGIGKDFVGGHYIVNHKDGQYVNGLANTNTAESYFALLKRGVHGTFHHISKKHLDKYCNEFSFRWNHRKETDGERTEEALKNMVGKCLMLKSLMGKTA